MTAMQLPAHLAARKRQNLAQTVIEQFGVQLPPHISIAGGRFKLVDAAGNEKLVETTYLDVIVVGLNEKMTRAYYEGAYNSDERLPPTCFSDNGVAASVRANAVPLTEAGIPARTCAECPKSRWGSATGVGGKGVPACKNGIKIAVLVPISPSIIFLLRVPPNSINPFKAYAKMAVGADVDITEIVTRITFNPDEQFTLDFKPTGEYVSETQEALQQQAWDSNTIPDIVGSTDVPRTLGLPPPAQKPVDPPAVAFMQQAATQQAAETPVQEPAKRRAGRPPKPAAEPLQQAPAGATPAAQVATGDLEVPAFLRRNPPAAAPSSPATPAAPGFMQPAQAPNAEIENALKRAFALKT